MSIANTVAPVMKWVPPSGGGMFTNYEPGHWEVDTQATQGAIANKYQSAAEDAFNNAISGLQGLVGSIGASGASNSASIQSLISGMGEPGSYETMRGLIDGGFGVEQPSSLGNLQSMIGQIGSMGKPSSFDGIQSMIGQIGSEGTPYSLTSMQRLANDIGGMKSQVGDFTPYNAPQSSFNLGNVAEYQQYLQQLGQSDAMLKGIQSSIGAIGNKAHDQFGLTSKAYDGVIGNLGGISDTIDASTSQLRDLNGEYDATLAGLRSLQGNFAPVYEQLTGQMDSLGQIARNIDSFLPGYVDQLNGMGSQMFDTGTSLVNSGGLFNQNAQALMNMDGSGGGLIGSYVSSLNSIDPDKYVSMAAADVVKQYANAQAQQARAAARSGVDAGSARSAALNQQYAQAMAAASAGAKFRARIQGQNEKLAALDAAAQTAGNLAQVGSSMVSSGIGAQQAGASVVGDAANLRLSGEGMKLNVENAKTNVSDAWLRAVAGQIAGRNAEADVIGGMLNVFNAGLNAQNSMAEIQSRIGNMESQRFADYLNTANLDLNAKKGMSEIEATRLAAQQAAAQMATDAALKTDEMNLNAQVQTNGQNSAMAQAMMNARINEESNRLGLQASLANNIASNEIALENNRRNTQASLLNSLMNGQLAFENNRLNAQISLANNLANNEVALENSRRTAITSLANNLANNETSRQNAQLQAQVSTQNAALSAQVEASKALAQAQQAAGQMYMAEAEGWGKNAGTMGIMRSLFPMAYNQY